MADDSMANRVFGSRWLKDEFVKAVFDCLRNIAISAAVTWAGLTFAWNPYGDPQFFIRIVALTLILGGLFLFVLNFLHTWKKLTELGLPLLPLKLTLIFLYVPAMALFYLQYRTKL